MAEVVCKELSRRASQIGLEGSTVVWIEIGRFEKQMSEGSVVDKSDKYREAPERTHKIVCQGGLGQISRKREGR